MNKKVLSPNFTQAGRTHTYTQKVATHMNWWRRNLLGLRTNISFASGFFITRSDGYREMSLARREVLRQLENRKARAIMEIDALVELIEQFQSLPLTLEDEAKNKLPKKRVKRDPLKVGG